MIRYNEIRDTFKFPEPVTLKAQWFAYSNGEVHGPFEHQKEARAVSNMVERVVVNQKEVNEYRSQYDEIENQVTDLWYRYLRQNHNYLNDETFELIYAEAYDRGHSSGYDEVSLHMDDLSILARKIIKANQ